MYYFRFPISKELTGREPPGYSPGWHGNMPHCPKGVTVEAYNDRDGYGIAWTDDDFVPPEVTVLKAVEVQHIMDNLNGTGADGVWRGEELAHRWDDKPEPVAVAVDGPGAMASDLLTRAGRRRAERRKLTKPAVSWELRDCMAYCAECKALKSFVARLSPGLVAAVKGRLNVIAKCPECGSKLTASVVHHG